MAIKPSTKVAVQKKPVKAAAPVKKPVTKSVSKAVVKPETTDIADMRKVIDLQAKQLMQLNKSVATLQTELKSVKSQLAAKEATPKAAPAKAPAKPAAKPAAKTPAKPTAKAPVKAPAKPAAKPAAKTPAKPTVKAPVKAPAKPVAKPAAKTPAKRGRKLVQPAANTMVPIPESIADRLNDLSTKKKITLTRFAEETDLSQTLIYDIAAKKLKTISFERIQKITTTLKKYETK
ncbi:MAG: helix-turn-helix transcriptional regulator [Methanospirillum sp.]|uniref:hypothetical protein n=1 Tax=Methanospirillum sp. TaxID=45200 RepID=UPI0023707334|nr:hypothetical protein [Methanospirillum sp.]MDD1728157.1 helix-turn-helix transcriptional regulator [Methanospirillum sp.]